MPNPNKAKGDRFESAAVLTAKDFFPEAFRTRAGWDEDRGDVVLTPTYSIIQQVKDCQQKPWYQWLDELDSQLKHSGASWGALVSKRRGMSDAGEAMAVMRNRDWLKMAARLHMLENLAVRVLANESRP